MIRIFDFIFSLLGVLFLWPVILIIMILGYFDTGSPLFRQRRLGKGRETFILLKFRTMSVDTKSVATHLAQKSSITPLGGFLRKSKLDELPQLINVLKGEMSLVGPRPNLENQEELIEQREKQGVYDYLPGITGLAQIKNIDMSTPKLLAEVDAKMLKNLTIKKYFQYIFMTIAGKGSGDNVINP
ncbi:sugar transferase [Nonlabens xiamenensis]|uniref:sugar transferase n=1 Tax=Nonlabens xiamenensis TaxID=2341043 RepID=UPI000F60E681|nr:sugar transferase [Nonlabens xiamenensis]